MNTQSPEPRRSPGLSLPLVSVVITSFNYENYIAEAIRSVSAQTYANYQCIVVDDASSDRSAAVAGDCIAGLNDERFCLVRNEDNLGQMGSMKAGLARARGVFVSFLDADDLLLPDFIAQHVAAHLNTSYSAGTTSSDTVQIDGSGAILEGTYPQFPKARELTAKTNRSLRQRSAVRIAEDGVELPPLHDPRITLVKRSVDGWHGVATSSFMFRKDLLELIVPADTTSLRICADAYFVKLAHFIAGTLVIEQALGCYRMHTSNSWAKNPRLGSGLDVGTFTLRELSRVTRLMIDHIVSNRGTFDRLLGVLFTRRLVYRLRLAVLLYRIAAPFNR